MRSSLRRRLKIIATIQVFFERIYKINRINIIRSILSILSKNKA
jgi:hypothetical protein